MLTTRGSQKEERDRVKEIKREESERGKIVYNMKKKKRIKLSYNASPNYAILN